MGVAFQDAVSSYAAQAATEYDYDVLDRLERLILTHRPRSVPETIAMLEVVIPNVEAGGRGDGADVQALQSILAYLGELPPLLTPSRSAQGRRRTSQSRTQRPDPAGLSSETEAGA